MTKISTYPFDSTPNLNDYVIGTDIDDANNTKNYSIGSILGLANLGNYVPYTGAVQNVNLGNYDLNVRDIVSRIIDVEDCIVEYVLNLLPSSEFQINGNAGTLGQVLVSGGPGGPPSWAPVPGITGYVPYTGATGSLFLGNNSLFVGNGNITITNGAVQANSFNVLGSLTLLSGAVISLPLTGTGNSGDVIVSNGPTQSPQWSSFSSLSRKGSFFHSVNQTAIGNNTPTPVRFNNTVIGGPSGVAILNDIAGNPSKIIVQYAGTYSVNFSCQVRNSSGGNHTLDVWLRLNGEDISPGTVADSNSTVEIRANATYVHFSRNWFINLNALDYIQVIWGTNDAANLILLYETNQTSPMVHPATPSASLTINQV